MRHHRHIICQFSHRQTHLGNSPNIVDNIYVPSPKIWLVRSCLLGVKWSSTKWPHLKFGRQLRSLKISGDSVILHFCVSLQIYIDFQQPICKCCLISGQSVQVLCLYWAAWGIWGPHSHHTWYGMINYLVCLFLTYSLPLYFSLFTLTADIIRQRYLLVNQIEMYSFKSVLAGKFSSTMANIVIIISVIETVITYSLQVRSKPWIINVSLGILSILVAMATLLLPETKDWPFPQSIEDVHTFTRGRPRARSRRVSRRSQHSGPYQGHTHWSFYNWPDYTVTPIYNRTTMI